MSCLIPWDHQNFKKNKASWRKIRFFESSLKEMDNKKNSKPKQKSTITPNVESQTTKNTVNITSRCQNKCLHVV